MSNLLAENLIHLSDVAKRLPPGRGKKVHTSTVFRWIHKGVVGPNGIRILLEHARIGKYRFTSLEALERFVAAINSAPESAPIVTVRSQSQRLRAAEKADTALKAEFGM